MLQRDRVQWITVADTPSCGQKRHTRWPPTNAKCWCAIARSEKTHTLACNECQVLMCHRAVRKDTHAGLQRMPRAAAPWWGQKRHTRWPATNAKCCCAIECLKKTCIFEVSHHPILAYLSSSSTSSNIIWISSGVFPNVGSQYGSRASSARNSA